MVPTVLNVVTAPVLPAALSNVTSAVEAPKVTVVCRTPVALCG